VDTLVWIALAFLLAVLVAGPWFVIRRGLAAYRTMRDSLAALTSALGAALGKLDDAPKHLDDAAAAGERLGNALERLSRSRARLTLLTTALAEVRASVTGAFGVVPRR
jgi:hypothetical protein